MHRPLAPLAALVLAMLVAAPSAGVSAAVVSVRVEGASRTLFEGPLSTDGHAVQATSDVRAHRCDGRNAGAHAVAGPTPTAAAADAMALSGTTLDGQWFTGYDDYFVSRLGPDAQTPSASWGILVDGAFTGVGGCQVRLLGGDELLWAYDAFSSRPFLQLVAAGAPVVAPDASLLVHVTQSSGGSEGGGAPTPVPAAGVSVAPVTTAANGVETTHPSDPATVVTAADGTATLTFHATGWQRVKATAPGFVRSNRLDVCVPAGPTTDCGPPPADAQLRIAPAPPLDPGPEPEAGAPPPAADPASAGRLDRTVRYLQNVQNRDGGFGGRRGLASDPGFSAWVALGLAAAGVNPQDQAQPGGADVYSYLTAHAGELSATTDYERVLLVAHAAGMPLRRFGAVDPVAALLARQLPDGSFAHGLGDGTGGVNDTIFALLALSQVGEPATGVAVQRGADWLLGAQRADGGWPGSSLSSPADADVTGAALQALVAAGRRDAGAEQRALAFLHTLQNADGGFGEERAGATSNAASTAWVVQGLWAVGADPSAWMTISGADPLAYLASLQQPDGAICWRIDDCTSNPIWMTAYAAPAFAGRPLPIAPVARAVRSSAAPAAEGVVAGGGGSGAPLFSRPQPQSRGHAAGGVRGTRAVATARSQPTRQATRSGGASRVRSTAGSTAPATQRGPATGGPAPSARSATGAGAGADVSGRLIGAAAGAGSTEARVAPGLRSARDDAPPGVVVAVALAIVLALTLGTQLERRRPEVAA